MEPPLPEVEQRFLVDADEAQRFLDAVRPALPIDVKEPSLPHEYVRTTYFDTDDFTLFRAELPGSAWRVRLRQYASAPDHVTPPRFGAACAFEVKEVASHGRRKDRVVGRPEEVARILRGCDGGWALRTGMMSPLVARAAHAVESGHLRPRLTTWFRRLTYAGWGARVTVDQCIEFASPCGLGHPGGLAAPRGVIGRGPPLVLEVKLRTEPPDWLSAAMRRLFLATRFSKFRDGLLALRQAERHALPDRRVRLAPRSGPI